MHTLNHLIILSDSEPTVEDCRLLAFATLMGVSAKIMSVPSGGVFSQCLLDEFQPETCCLAISAATLVSINNSSASGCDLQKLINGFSAAVLIFGCTNAREHLTAISSITSGVISEISSFEDQVVRFAFPREAESFSRQLAGLSFSGAHEHAISAFAFHNTAAAEVVITANQHPIFARITRGSCEVFLLSTPMPELDAPLSRRLGIEAHYHRLIPVLIFLRHCFRESCWHGSESTARLIIDDPLLREKYGFLDCSVLMKSMEKARYGTSIAFIPWNHWRTSRRNATRLLSENSSFAICVHGCDHTNKEFETRDATLLDRKAGLALGRMESLQKRTGTAFERIMVFPQGRFSTAAIMALRANGYLAAVNSTCFPRNSGPDDLNVGDFLLPAVTRYSGFPIFQRHYPRRLFDFAFDLFLGKPALIVEHHEYFQDGCRRLEEFVAELYQLEPALSWPSLTTQLTRSCWKRELSDGSVEVQFFTSLFQLSNCKPYPYRFLLRKNEPDPTAIESVMVNGKRTPFLVEDGFLKVEVQADPGKVLNVEITDREHQQRQANGFGVLHNTGVLVRRGLSEFRDTTLSRHAGLLKVAKRVARKLKVTGEA